MKLHKVALGVAAVMTVGAGSLAQADEDYYSIKDSVVTAPSAQHTWTGLHIGANIGGLFAGEANTNTSSVFDNTPFKFNSLNALAGGAQIGYDVEVNHWVWGVEGDFQWSGIDDRAKGDPTIPLDVVDGKLNWFGTARVRLGYSYGRFMPYITGGLAYGNFEGRYAEGPWTKETNIGWTVGGGAELALDRHWSVRGEYLYLSFPSRDIFIPNTVNGTYAFDYDTHYARGALSHKF